MKKIIEILLVSALVCFSFFYTDKVMNLVNEKNPLMQQINSLKNNYEILPVSAIIEDDTIIPGIKGREIDVSKSYDNMKIGGIFREDALIYKDLYPKESLDNNKDKYIIQGNPNKKEVAILIILNTNNISKVKEIENITIFLNHKDITFSNISTLKEKEIYPYGQNGNYLSEELKSDNSLINRLSHNKSAYCLAKDKNKEVLETCQSMGMHVVIPSIKGGYYSIQNDLCSGSIILLDNLNDINMIVKYIKGKGYNITTLSKLLNE